MRALLYLEYRTFINHAKLTLTTPKRLVPAVIWLAAMFWLLVVNPSSHHHTSDTEEGLSILAKYVGYVWPAVFTLTLLITAVCTLRALSTSMIIFQPAELDYLIPSPIRRSTVLARKLATIYRATIGIPIFFLIAYAPKLYATLAASGRGYLVWAAYGGFLLYAFLVVNVCTLVNLISTHRARGRWWAGIAILGAAFGLPALMVVLAVHGAMSAGGFVGFLRGFRNSLLAMLLFPLSAAVDLILSPLTGWHGILWLDLVVLASMATASLVFLLGRRENPYEPSLGTSMERIVRQEAIAKGGSAAVLSDYIKRHPEMARPKRTVPPFGTGAYALLWKNAIYLVRLNYMGYALTGAIGLLICVAPFAVMQFVPESGHFPVTGVVVVALGLVTTFCSLMWTEDLHRDLIQSNIIKSLPEPAWKLMAVETLHGTAAVTLVAWGLVLLTLVLYRPSEWLNLVLLAVVVPFIANAAACVPIAISVAFPNKGDFIQSQTAASLSAMAGFGTSIGLWVLGLVAAGIVGPILAALGIIMVSSAFAVAGVAVGALLYQRFDPTSE